MYLLIYTSINEEGIRNIRENHLPVEGCCEWFDERHCFFKNQFNHFNTRPCIFTFVYDCYPASRLQQRDLKQEECVHSTARIMILVNIRGVIEKSNQEK